MSLQLIVEALTSFRGTERSLEVFGRFHNNVESPTFYVICQWIYRIGLYLLSNRKIEERDDRILILDHTIQSGVFKCLLILETTAEKVAASNFSLTHKDVDVVDIKIMKNSNGEIIRDILNDLKEKNGSLKQIVTDGGSDLKKGVELFRQSNPDTIQTYDITHAVAAIVKKELEDNERFNEFLNKCSHSICKLKQTRLSFLMPPSQRNKSLYLNISRYIDWAYNLLKYEKQGDYSLIELTAKEDISHLKKFCNNVSTEKKQPNCIDASVLQKKVRNNYAKKLFNEKFGWISDYENDLKSYMEVSEMVKVVQKQIKTDGIKLNAHVDFAITIGKLNIKSKNAKNIRNRIVDHLKSEGSKIPLGMSLLGSSDVIESLFGKQKNFSAKCPVKEMGKMTLMTPLLVGDTLKKSVLIKKALETTTYNHVKDWYKNNFGKTARSKRIEAFGNTSDTTLIQHENIKVALG